MTNPDFPRIGQNGFDVTNKDTSASNNAPEIEKNLFEEEDEREYFPGDTISLVSDELYKAPDSEISLANIDGGGSSTGTSANLSSTETTTNTENGTNETGEDEGDEDYNTAEWEEIEIKKPFWGNTCTYKAENGMELKFEYSDDVIVKKNKYTGEIYIDNANNLAVVGSTKDDKLTISGSKIHHIETGYGDDTIKIINNSSMESSLFDNFNTGDGDDTVVIKNSKISEAISTWNGNDTVIAADSEIAEIKTGVGADYINLINTISINIDMGDGLNKAEINNSTIETLKSGKDEDVFRIENTNILKELKTGAGDDSVIVTKNSQLAELNTSSGADSVYVQGSTINDIELGKDEDVININNSRIDMLNAGDGADRIALFDNTNVKTLDSGKGEDSVVSNKKGVKIENNKGGDEIVETKNGIKAEGLLTDYSVAEGASETTKDIVSKYINKESITPEEEWYALTIDMFQKQLDGIKSQYEEQKKSDGVVGNAYNTVKEMMQMGISENEIKNAIADQEKMIKEMTDALNSKDSSKFEQVFKNWTGVDYNETNISEFLDYQQSYDLVSISEAKIVNFAENVYKASTIEDVMDLYTQKYGSEEKAREELNKVLDTIPVVGAIYSNSKIRINDNNQIESTDNTSGTYQPIGSSLKDYPNIISSDIKDKMIKTALEEYEAKFKAQNDYSVEALQDIYLSKQVSTMGTGSSFQKLIDKYCSDQSTIEDRVGSVAQIGGIAMMAGGGLLTFVCPPIGAAMMNVGSYTAFAGTFLDNGLDAIDAATSQEGITPEKARELFKETVLDAALYASGVGIGKIAEGANAVAQAALENSSKSLQTLVGWAAQVGTDTTLSMITDLALTGEIDLAGEGMSQLLGIISGIAGAKVDSYYKESFDVANSRVRNNDIDGAYDYLKTRGISDKKIYKTYSDIEQSKVFDYYKTTGDYDGALKMIEDSKILNLDVEQSKLDFENMCSKYGNNNADGTPSTDPSNKPNQRYNSDGSEQKPFSELSDSGDLDTTKPVDNNERIEEMRSRGVTDEDILDKVINLNDFQYKMTQILMDNGIAPDESIKFSNDSSDIECNRLIQLVENKQINTDKGFDVNDALKFVKSSSQLTESQYNVAVLLETRGWNGSVEEATTLSDIECNRVLDLVAVRNISENDALNVIYTFRLNADLSDIKYNKLLDLLDRGVDVNKSCYVVRNTTDTECQRVLDLLDNGVDVYNSWKIAKNYSDSQYESAIKLINDGHDINFVLSTRGDINNIGLNDVNGVSLSNISNLDTYWDEINTVKNGERLDPSLADWKIKVGDKEVSILTDNNIVTNEYLDLHKSDVDISSGRIITKEDMKAVEKAIARMQATGQKIPDNIYLTSLFSTNDLEKAVGVFSAANPDSVFLKSNSLLNADTEFLKSDSLLNADTEFLIRSICHESAHMADYDVSTNKCMSDSQGIIIKPNEFIYTIEFGDITLQNYAIDNLISSYALKDNNEFVAEVTALISSGTIRVDNNGKYTIITDDNGYYFDAHMKKTSYSSDSEETLNNIMSLYNAMTNGGLAQALPV